MKARGRTRRDVVGDLGSIPRVAAAAQGAELPDADRAGTAPKTPEEALAALKEGNQRFVTGKVRHAHQAADWRAHLTGGQQPFATILACSDSRVPPELVFDQGFGDLFVIRVAGNIIARDILGSVAYAIRHLKTPLVVVMGHEGCGAVTAALDALDGKGDEPKYITGLLEHILPALKQLDPSLQGDRRVNAGVEANVRQSAEILSQLPMGKQAIEQNPACLARAVYELGTGHVRFLD